MQVWTGLDGEKGATKDPIDCLAGAAKAFEAIFVRQMLSSARQAGFGNELFSSQGTQTFQAMQDEKFAEVAAHSGAFGFAKVIEAQLSRHLDAQPATPAKEG